MKSSKGINNFSQIRQTYDIGHKLVPEVINYSHLAVIIYSNHNFANSCFANIHDMTSLVSWIMASWQFPLPMTIFVTLSLCIMITPPSHSLSLSSSGDGDRRGDITEITSTDLMRELRIMSMGALDTVNSDHHQHSTHPVKSIVYNLGIADKRNV